MKVKKRVTWLMLLIITMTALLSGCKAQRTATDKVKDLEFTVVEDDDVPSELKRLIEEKKQDMFKLSYSDSEYLYIIAGYGEQSTGGYSITVDELYMTDNAIYIDTNLIGPGKDEQVTQVLTYPYVVVKTEFMDLNVVFE